MLEHIRLKRGLNIPITGEALCKVSKRVVPTLIALKPTDFRGVTPKLLVKEGDSVIPGTPIFADKKHPEIVFCSPCKGSVSEIVRGDKRKLLAITIKPNNDAQVQSYDIPKLETSDRQEVIDILLKHGLWPCIKQRPYGIIADPGVTPKSIFVSCMNTAPLAANLEFSLQNNFENLQAGVNVLSKLTKGGIHFSLDADNFAGTDFHKLTGVIYHSFYGPHPAGNVGVQINHISPINKGETVWTIDLFLLVAIGNLFRTGTYDMSRTVAVAGPAAVNPSYVKCLPGTSMSDLSEYFGSDKDVRVISGDILTGETIGKEGFLGFYNNLITVLPEGNYYEMFGWVKPFRLNKFSFSHSYFSWLMPKKKYNMDTNTNGGERAFVVSDVYSKVLPMDIYPVYLFKAILAENIERMEELGIYEVIEEDVALCEFVCPSKIDIQSIVSKGIDIMLKEME
ncbi:MAG: Na(+)-translocating NADH-quinone reductase subunit A [Bacteroidales bacterium]|nr:Na(+)-translocating NADH-quinone reductase subunit A [Bacteroidales bacterium]MDD4670268.1 Na(+)-translocating NADH-quinone reductase subunit A [Bacteroidales bacterium]